jgi:hypothetical protein
LKAANGWRSPTTPAFGEFRRVLGYPLFALETSGSRRRWPPMMPV